MKKSPIQVTVLSNFNGLYASKVEVIERLTIMRGKQGRRERWVSYKGKLYQTFVLPECYEVEHPICISV